ncbi:MAG: hypothetical protein R3F14_18680 [Polyangiaceae bacterium]
MRRELPSAARTSHREASLGSSASLRWRLRIPRCASISTSAIASTPGGIADGLSPTSPAALISCAAASAGSTYSADTNRSRSIDCASKASARPRSPLTASSLASSKSTTQTPWASAQIDVRASSSGLATWSACAAGVSLVLVFSAACTIDLLRSAAERVRLLHLTSPAAEKRSQQ